MSRLLLNCAAVFCLAINLVRVTDGFDASTPKLPRNILEILVNLTRNEVLLSQTGDTTELSDCLKTILLIGNALERRDEWAIQFADAQFKPAPGILQGRMHHFGSFDECLAIDHIEPYCQNNRTCHIQGQYCSWAMEIPINELVTKLGGFRVGVCLPTYCTAQEQTTLLRQLSQIIGFKTTLIRCDANTPLTWSARQIVILCVMSFILFCMLTGFILDMYQRAYQKTLEHTACAIFLSFSPYTNAAKILHTGKKDGSLDCLNGIRFLSMAWVILGHTYAFTNYIDTINLADMEPLLGTVAIQMIFNATLSVDTFFFIGGLLVSYVTLTQMQKCGGKMNWFHYYFHRIWRLTPAYGLVMSLLFLWEPIGSGPTWVEAVEGYTLNCAKNWWTTLLYISNFVPDKERCMGHGWYLSNDMQFYLISPVLLILLYKFEKWGHLSNIILSAGSCLLTLIMIDVYQYASPTFSLQGTLDPSDTYKDYVYIKPYTRIAPYCLGLTVGQLILNHAEQLKTPYFSDKRVHYIGWTLFSYFMLATLFGTRPWNEVGNMDNMTNMDHFLTGLYGGTFRLGWTFAMAWLVLCCTLGYGGIINSFLSWTPFIPLGRLTYLAYLIHPIILYNDTGRARTNFYFTGYTTVMRFFSYLLMSYLLAFLATLAFEAPFIGLEKVILSGGSKKKQQNSPPPSARQSTLEPCSVQIAETEKL